MNAHKVVAQSHSGLRACSRAFLQLAVSLHVKLTYAFVQIHQSLRCSLEWRQTQVKNLVYRGNRNLQRLRRQASKVWNSRPDSRQDPPVHLFVS